MGRSLVELAQHRSRCYQYLARGFQQPTEASLALLFATPPFEDLAEIIPTPFLQALGTWERELDTMREQDVRVVLQGLQGRYLRLFVGPYQLHSLPYESLYIGSEGLLMGEAAARVRKEYEGAGLTLAAAFLDLPDHIAVELEFMGFLCASEAQAWRDEGMMAGLSILRRERTFLNEHLTCWLPPFLGRLREIDEAGPYLALGELVLSFVRMDLDWCNAWIHTFQEMPSPAGADDGHGP